MTRMVECIMYRFVGERMNAYNLTESQMTDVQFNGKEYLPFALYTIGCHSQHLTKRQLKCLISELTVELRQRDYLLGKGK